MSARFSPASHLLENGWSGNNAIPRPVPFLGGRIAIDNPLLDHAGKLLVQLVMKEYPNSIKPADNLPAKGLVMVM